MLPITPGSLKIDGQRQTGDNVRVQNVRAAEAVAAVVRSSLGPIGLDKMLVDDMGEVTLTNDGATILKQLDVQHPAGKVLIQLSELQDREVGDGTTTVVLLAAELLRLGQELIDQKVHANTVISGYRQAAKAGISFLKSHLAVSSDEMNDAILKQVAHTSMASKVLSTYTDFFSQMVVDACNAVKTVSGKTVKCPTTHINIVKALGQSLPESHLISNGIAVNARRSAEAMPRMITNAKVAVLDMGLARTRMPMGVQIRIKNIDDLDKFQKKEVEQAQKIVEAMIKAGATCIITNKTIDESCLKPMVKAGMIAVRHVADGEIAAVARATGATIVKQVGNDEQDHYFDPEWLGTCGKVEQVVIGDNEMIVFSECSKENSASIILRGPNTFTLDEANRALRDALFAVKRAVESRHVTAGGGAVEAGLSVHLSKIAATIKGKEQVAFLKFAEALLVIPKILANNAALDSIDLVAQLRAAHFAVQEANAAIQDPTKHQKCFASLNLFENTIHDGYAAGIIEPAMSKVKSIQFATEAAITILRIDDLIKVTPEKRQDPNADDD